MQTYMVTLTGKTPLLMHADNIEWADVMEAWKNAPSNKKGSKAGDDRSPAWRWLGGLYHDGQVIGLPVDNLMRCFMEGGALVPVPGGKNGKTFKAQTQSGMLVSGGALWPVLVDGKQIPYAPIAALNDVDDFAEHQRVVERFGFSLFLKRAKIGTSKHVRVRPRFERWTASGMIDVWDKQITADVLRDIVKQAGLYKGLGDWRPGGKTPGSFGMFEATIEE